MNPLTPADRNVDTGNDPLVVRRLALKILTALEQSDRTLDDVFEDALRGEPPFDPRDRALLQAIVYGVLRRRRRIDHTIAAFSKTPIRKIRPDILTLLRIGIFQAAYLDRIPASAAVNTTVELAKRIAPPWLVKYLNAVLRKAVIGHSAVSLPAAEQDPVTALAVAHAFPDWLIRRWLARFGTEETLRLCEKLNSVPPITLRVNTLKIGRGRLIRELRETARVLEQTGYSPEGVRIEGPLQPIAQWEPYRRGWFQVQDEAAQMITWLLAPKPGEAILDACAGLGGKTAHIAQHMENRGSITAVDLRSDRLAALESEMVRLGISIVRTECVDLLAAPLQQKWAPYDRVLLDAPCSGLGVLRRNPDAKWQRQESMLAVFGRRQRALLARLAALVKPGGLLVYAVCSTEPEETDAVIGDFLMDHRKYAVEPQPGSLPQTAGDLISAEGFLRTYPHRHDMDGFFAVCLRRTR